MVARGCISRDFIWHAIPGVTGNAVAMGEAAGVVSALVARDRLLPHNLEWEKVAPVHAKIRA
ncbi:MAG: hypothetical protein ACKVHO_24850 [Verrucomicrobiia bacterium]